MINYMDKHILQSFRNDVTVRVFESVISYAEGLKAEGLIIEHIRDAILEDLGPLGNITEKYDQSLGEVREKYGLNDEECRKIHNISGEEGGTLLEQICNVIRKFGSNIDGIAVGVTYLKRQIDRMSRNLPKKIEFEVNIDIQIELHHHIYALAYTPRQATEEVEGKGIICEKVKIEYEGDEDEFVYTDSVDFSISDVSSPTPSPRQLEDKDEIIQVLKKKLSDYNLCHSLKDEDGEAVCL